MKDFFKATFVKKMEWGENTEPIHRNCPAGNEAVIIEPGDDFSPAFVLIVQGLAREEMPLGGHCNSNVGGIDEMNILTHAIEHLVVFDLIRQKRLRLQGNDLEAAARTDRLVMSDTGNEVDLFWVNKNYAQGKDVLESLKSVCRRLNSIEI